MKFKAQKKSRLTFNRKAWLTVVLMLAISNNSGVKAQGTSKDRSGEKMTNSANASNSVLFSTFVGEEKLDENSKRELPKFKEAYELQKAQKTSNAVALYQEVITACPTRYEAFYNLGVCQQALGQMPDALQSFENVVRLNKLYKPVYTNLAAVHEKLGDPEKAKAVRAILNQL